MEPVTDPTLQPLIDHISTQAWEMRVRAADEEAALMRGALARVLAGERRGQVLREVFPNKHRETALRRLRFFEKGGRDALIDRRLPKRPVKATAEMKGAVRALLHEDDQLRSEELCDQLEALFGVRLGGSTMREVLRELNLAQPVGRPSGRPAGKRREAKTEPLPLAGAELLKAVEEKLGAVRALTKAMEKHMKQLPAPSGEVLDDREHRDERGRFLGSYNAPKSRTEPEFGGKLDSVERRRGEKDLRDMRVANSSFVSRYRKDLALTLMPVVVDAPRWSVLKHWQGDHLGTLVDFPYQPATLDKHARELKLADASQPARESVTSFWMSKHGEFVDAQTGVVVVYGDASTKPIWTRHFTKSLKVSKTGRIQPGISTMVLHSGAGTPLVYRSFSGTASVPKEVGALLRQYEQAAGEGTARRMVVLDRESHAAWLFKELDEDWLYIVPLKSNVTGPKAKFEEVSEWTTYGETEDKVCDGWLWLNDSRPKEPSIRVRVVGRHRHRTGKVSWYATNSEKAEFSGTHVLRLYFERWPKQEHRFRDGNGCVGLDVHHGYGKKKIDNVAVIDKLEKLEGRQRRLEKTIADADDKLALLDEDVENYQQAEVNVAEHIGELESNEEAEVTAGRAGSRTFHQTWESLRVWRSGFPTMQRNTEELKQARGALREEQKERRSKVERLEREQDKLARRTKIFTVDVVLDEIMLAYKLTFMNLAAVLMDQFLGVRMELDTLIRAVLTLPGEREQTKTTETIRIYRQPRDPSTMEAVGRACERLTALELTRGPPDKQRRLLFALVDPPGT